MKKIQCIIGIHKYQMHFTPYADQPFLNGRVENELCVVEGRHTEKCKFCDKEIRFRFEGRWYEKGFRSIWNMFFS